MKVINENDLIGTERDVKFKEGTSIRMILEKDRMGFSFHKTIITKGKNAKSCIFPPFPPRFPPNGGNV